MRYLGILFLTLMLAGCGSGGDRVSSESISPSPTATTPAPPAPITAESVAAALRTLEPPPKFKRTLTCLRTGAKCARLEGALWQLRIGWRGEHYGEAAGDPHDEWMSIGVVDAGTAERGQATLKHALKDLRSGREDVGGAMTDGSAGLGLRGWARGTPLQYGTWQGARQLSVSRWAPPDGRPMPRTVTNEITMVRGQHVITVFAQYRWGRAPGRSEIPFEASKALAEQLDG